MNTTSALDNGILFLTLTGDLIGSPDTQQLLDSVNEYLGDAAVINCAVDLSGIRYINSTGIGVLVSLLTKFPADHPKKMLALTKLNNIFIVADDAATARQQLTVAAS
jgi:anti-sigma B factor antagonist